MIPKIMILLICKKGQVKNTGALRVKERIFLSRKKHSEELKRSVIEYCYINP